MTCASCKHEFCWMCMGLWKDHGNASGGYYKCNKFEEDKKSGKVDKESIQREAVKNELNKYIHYYERYQNNQVANKYAI